MAYIDRIIVPSTWEDEAGEWGPVDRRLADANPTQMVDMPLVHGHEGRIVGDRGREWVGAETFNALLRAYRSDPANLDRGYGDGYCTCYGSRRWPQPGWCWELR